MIQLKLKLKHIFLAALLLGLATQNLMAQTRPEAQPDNHPMANMIKAQPKTITKTVVKTPNVTQAALSQEAFIPFGYNLFHRLSPKTDLTGVSPHYKIVPGDRIKLNIWGAFSNESTVSVDAQGNIFIPEVGPIKVAGVQASKINALVQSKIGTVYQDTVDVYINLEDRVPVSVFVAGHVVSPGRHAGNPGDGLIDYLIRAGGIDLNSGSFRDIIIKRNHKIIERFDLYDFLLKGILPQVTLQEGDSIVIGPQTRVVKVDGSAERLSYELPSNNKGYHLLEYAQIDPETTHVLISGVRENLPYNRYVTLNDFAQMDLEDGDLLTFEAGIHSTTFNVTISGEHLGAKTMTIPRDARLHEVLNNIPVNPLLSRIDAVHLKRRTVAEKQRKSIQDSIKRLQETLLLARASGNSTHSAVSEGELQLLDKFMARTEALQPEGRVVVIGRKNILDIALEPNDEIVIPARSDLISINGEVMLPQAIAWNEKDSVVDYVMRSGGFTDNANESKILVIRANGETEIGRGVKILPGDDIIVMPEVKLNNLELASNIADILYKTILAVAIPLTFND